jgi:hypothetical protein
MAMPRFYQVSLRTILELVFVAAVLFAFIYWRNVPRNPPGRFQMLSAGREQVQIIFLDTSTGKAWRGNAFGQYWEPIDTPAEKAK